MFVFGGALWFSILPSQVAFTSLISAGGIPTTAAYGLIALLRLTMTPNDFKNSHFYLGRWRIPFYIATVLFNGLVFAGAQFAVSILLMSDQGPDGGSGRRLRPGAAPQPQPVAVPVAWEELPDIDRASLYTIRDAPLLLERSAGRALSGWGQARQALPDA